MYPYLEGVRQHFKYDSYAELVQNNVTNLWAREHVKIEKHLLIMQHENIPSKENSVSSVTDIKRLFR